MFRRYGAEIATLYRRSSGGRWPASKSTIGGVIPGRGITERGTGSYWMGAAPKEWCTQVRRAPLFEQAVR